MDTGPSYEPAQPLPEVPEPFGAFGSPAHGEVAPWPPDPTPPDAWPGEVEAVSPSLDFGDEGMIKNTDEITKMILKAAEATRAEMQDHVEPAFSGRVKWPVQCTVGPGLEGAIACESKVGYVNGTKGALIYRGYDIFDLCAYATFEEVAFLLLRGKLPSERQLDAFKTKLVAYRRIPRTLRIMMSFPVERMNAMAALRLGTNMMRQEFTQVDDITAKRGTEEAIGTDEDSIPMETMPRGEEHAIYEVPRGPRRAAKQGYTDFQRTADDVMGMESCYHVLAGVSTIAAAISRLRHGLMPLEPHPELGLAANYLYMITGREPTPVEARIMDVCLILHADHGMNASTFASLVVASTLSDVYLSVGSGIAALNGPLHGGANEQVLRTLHEIGDADAVPAWYERARERKRKIMGFGHRVYKTYDPRARVLGPLAKRLTSGLKDVTRLLATAQALEKAVVDDLGAAKGIYPNVDFYSGLVYTCLGVPEFLFTPTFAVARVAGWTSRVMEYLVNNRIFRPRAIYSGPFDREFVPLKKRGRGKA